MKLRVRGVARSLRRRAEQKVARWRFATSVRPSDVFIVTYPKSGTVWLSFLIANVLNKSESQPLNLRNYHAYIANINDLYFGNGSLRKFAARPDPRFFWVHARYEREFPTVLYVLRDPRDVMVSYWHWKKLNDAQFSDSLAQFVARDEQWPCRWDEHVAEWILNHKHPRLMLVRYEDLRRDTAGELGRVLDFLRIGHSAEEIERAVTAATFTRMKSLEEELRSKGETFGLVRPGRPVADKEERFMRRGNAGGWKEELDGESLRILESKYGDVMRKVGYETSVA